MAGQTKCYKVTIGEDGALQREVVEFSPRYADNIPNALMRLRERAILKPPHVKFHDWWELVRQWDAERAEYRALMICQFDGCESPLCDITAADGVSQREAELLIAAGWDGAEDAWYCPAHKHLLKAVTA